MFNLASYVFGLAGYIAVTPASHFLDSLEYNQTTALGVGIMVAVLFQQFIHVTKGENQPTELWGSSKPHGAAVARGISDDDWDPLHPDRLWEHDVNRRTNPAYSFRADNIHHSSHGNDGSSPFD
ncbi:hypothetical protein [Halomonas sp. I5-271120]|uniref:hypothetical protein n=1 Tax=Halomonas sp. I5-271120 TaxID=3061632 RepID=UPI002715366D|nr:hypothetical protein [Halomonas sp. I5-271120]